MGMKQQTDIPFAVRQAVMKRDSLDGAPCCIYCGSPKFIELAHYVPRSRGGMGVESNLACLCHKCHEALDNGSDIRKARDIKMVFKDWMVRCYPGWTEEGQVYRK